MTRLAILAALALAGCAGQNLNASLPLPIKSCTGAVSPDGSVTTTCEFVVPEAAPVPSAVVPAEPAVVPTAPG